MDSMYISLQMALNGGGDRAKKYSAGLLTFLLVSYARVLEVIQDQTDKRVI